MTESNEPKHSRSARNYLLQPNLQLKLGFVSILVATLFSALIISLTYVSLSSFYSMVLDLTDLREEVVHILEQYISSMSWWIIGLIILYLAVNVCLSIYYTHRLVGPTVAFRRHIINLIEGDYTSRVHLRKNDAFSEVAEVLNRLAQNLEGKESANVQE